MRHRSRAPEVLVMFWQSPWRDSNQIIAPVERRGTDILARPKFTGARNSLPGAPRNRCLSRLQRGALFDLDEGQNRSAPSDQIHFANLQLHAMSEDTLSLQAEPRSCIVLRPPAAALGLFALAASHLSERVRADIRPVLVDPVAPQFQLRPV